MPDPTSTSQMVQQAHQMSTLEMIMYGLTVFGSAVGGAIMTALRFGTRVSKLEEGESARAALAAEVGKLRDECRATEVSVGTAKADPMAVRMAVDQAIATAMASVRAGLTAESMTALQAALGPAVQNAVSSQVAAVLSPLQREFDRLSSRHDSTKEELDRVRDAADRAEEEGARRWAEWSRIMGELTNAVKNG